jgi:hypothetical protein
VDLTKEMAERLRFLIKKDSHLRSLGASDFGRILHSEFGIGDGRHNLKLLGYLALEATAKYFNEPSYFPSGFKIPTNPRTKS